MNFVVRYASLNVPTTARERLIGSIFDLRERAERCQERTVASASLCTSLSAESPSHSLGKWTRLASLPHFVSIADGMQQNRVVRAGRRLRRRLDPELAAWRSI